MRITAGKNKGKKLVEFNLDSTRPTSDIVRQALFNIIGERIFDSKFLDLFGGTGAVGCEAESRNASEVYIVDNNNESIKIINKNLQLIKSSKSKVLKCDYEDALNNFIKQGITFDVVFIDPPYASDYAEKSLEIIFKNHIINDGGIIIWEHDKSKLELAKGLGATNTKKYGIKYLSIFRIAE